MILEEIHSVLQQMQEDGHEVESINVDPSAVDEVVKAMGDQISLPLNFRTKKYKEGDLIGIFSRIPVVVAPPPPKVTLLVREGSDEGSGLQILQ